MRPERNDEGDIVRLVLFTFSEATARRWDAEAALAVLVMAAVLATDDELALPDEPGVEVAAVVDQLVPPLIAAPAAPPAPRVALLAA
jgi:hypothetical protein